MKDLYRFSLTLIQIRQISLPVSLQKPLIINVFKVQGSICIIQSEGVKFVEMQPACAALCIDEANLRVKFDEELGLQPGNGLWVIY